jgi:exopolyphosphatase/guanosine-5'-triphosphate,3'-diphosphate pyrophosphatase
VTRLGRGVDLSGQLSAEAIEDVCAAIGEYVEVIRELGAERVDAIATSAVRDATNGSAFIAELRERFALSARVLDGEEEARLTYLGATSEQVPTQPTLVVDIGGGSTELIVGSGREIGFHTSLQVGVVRHTERHIASDPPTASELEALANDVRGRIESAIDGGVSAEEGIAVAGTPTSLAAVEMELEPSPFARSSARCPGSLRFHWPSGCRFQVSTRTAPRRSSPASSSWSRRCAPSGSSRSPSPSTTSSMERRLRPSKIGRKPLY